MCSVPFLLTFCSKTQRGFFISKKSVFSLLYVSPSLSLLTASLAAATSFPSSWRAFVRSRAPAIVGVRPEEAKLLALEEEEEEEGGDDDDDDGDDDRGIFQELEELEPFELDAAALARSWTSSTKSRALPRSSASQMPAEARDSETAAPRDSAAAAAAAAASARGSADDDDSAFFLIKDNELFFVWHV